MIWEAFVRPGWFVSYRRDPKSRTTLKMMEVLGAMLQLWTRDDDDMSSPRRRRCFYGWRGTLLEMTQCANWKVKAVHVQCNCVIRPDKDKSYILSFYSISPSLVASTVSAWPEIQLRETPCAVRMNQTENENYTGLTGGLGCKSGFFFF